MRNRDWTEPGLVPVRNDGASMSPAIPRAMVTAFGSDLLLQSSIVDMAHYQRAPRPPGAPGAKARRRMRKAERQNRLRGRQHAR